MRKQLKQEESSLLRVLSDPLLTRPLRKAA